MDFFFKCLENAKHNEVQMLIWAVELNANNCTELLRASLSPRGWLLQGQPVGAASGSLDLAVRSAVWCCNELNTSQFGSTWSPERRHPGGDIPPLKPHQYPQPVKFQTFNSHEVCIYTHTRTYACISGWKYCKSEHIYCGGGRKRKWHSSCSQSKIVPKDWAYLWLCSWLACLHPSPPAPSLWYLAVWPRRLIRTCICD